MCVVSMVHEHYQTWPSPFTPAAPTFPPPLHPDWTWERWNEYQELLRKAAEYDKRVGQPDCPDPNKEAMMQEIERRLIEKYGLQPQTK